MATTQKNSASSPTHVYVPHDGPLYHFAIENEHHLENDRVNNNIGVSQALELINEPDNVINNIGMMKYKGALVRLLNDLLPASSELRIQLKALQGFRSNLLQLMKEKVKESLSCQLKQVFMGIYRVLLELALSYNTPTSMRRATASCLDSLDESLSDEVDFEDIRRSVIESVLSISLTDSNWKDPIQSFFEVCNLPLLRNSLRCIGSDTKSNPSYVLDVIQLFLYQGQDIAPTLQRYENCDRAVTITDQKILDCVERGSRISCTLKLLFPILEDFLQTLPHDNDDKSIIRKGLVDIEQQILFPVLSSHATNGDVLSNTGASLSQVFFLQWNYFSKTTAEKDIVFEVANNVLEKTKFVSASLSSLQSLALIRGMTATIPYSVLLTLVSLGNDVLLINALASRMLDQAQKATEASVRLSAMRGLETVMSRLLKIVEVDSNSCFSDNKNTKATQALADTFEHLMKAVLDVVFQEWESPVSRSITASSAILFSNIVKILHVTKDNPNFSDNLNKEGLYLNMDLENLIRTVLAQPSNRKGRYVALDIMLPLIGAQKLIKISDEFSSSSLVTELIFGIGGDDRGRNKNSGAIGDLLSKLLCQLRTEMSPSEQKEIKLENKKERRKKERLAKKAVQAGLEHPTSKPDERPSQLSLSWIKIWAPPLASVLLFASKNRRTQTAAFCLPLVADIAGSRKEAPHAYCALLTEVKEIYQHSVEDERVHEGLADCYLWAKLEIAKHVSLHKLTKTSESLRKSISEHISLNLLKCALVNASSSIRLVGYSSIDVIIASHYSTSNTFERVQYEVQLWIETLPYACKCSEKEYAFKMLQYVAALLHRIALATENASQIMDKSKPEANNLLQSFVCDFLIRDLCLKQGSYPGTALEKEQFILSLMRCILTFISDSFPSFVPILSPGQKQKKSHSKGVIGKKQVTKRSFSESYYITMKKILQELLSNDVFSSLLSLQHSMWDRTRSTAFELCRDILHCAIHLRDTQSEKVSLPYFLITMSNRNTLYARAVHLASSPRQRESDTGAKLLALLFASTVPSHRGVFISDLLNLLEHRLETMQTSLRKVLSLESSGLQETATHGDATYELPLAHGLIQALRLSVEFAKFDCFPLNSACANNENNPNLDEKGIPHGSDSLTSIYEHIVSVCCRSIEVSLAVVSDLKQDDDDNDDENLSGSQSRRHGALSQENQNQNQTTESTSGTPLNVNTGAIGANAVFASVKTMSEDEEIRRTATQRVIIGSWLLTREACAALASTIETSPVPISHTCISSSGTLLLRTLLSLKHQGAAFAAHKALEQISTACVNISTATSSDPRSHNLPSKWANDLLYEISAKETVRDSTLRRSTGIALGFLSIMRSEPPATVSPRTICPFVLSNLVRLSLPPELETKKRLKSFDCGSMEEIFIFPKYLNHSEDSQCTTYISDSDYQARSRVHALNVLRFSILDAPLATEMRKFVGDAIVSALLGYNDKSWGVRNSATMVFSAAMLRVIDADKNASSNEHKTNKSSVKPVLGSANAISARELFRTYPNLSPFLIAALKESMGLPIKEPEHPSLYPILLLLSRLQSASSSGGDEGIHDIVAPFISPVIQCLGHKQHKIRIMAARALAKLCTGDGDEINILSSRKALLMECESILIVPESQYCDWNKCHGALLGIQTLLRGSSNTSFYVGKGKHLGKLLLGFATWCINISGPPTCIAVALQTINDTKRSNNEFYDVTDSYFEQLLWNTLDMKTSMQQSKDMIGLARMNAILAELCCDFSARVIFDINNTNEEERNFHIKKILDLFRSSPFDVRFAAIKAFKKPLYDRINKTIMTSNVEVSFFLNVLYLVSKMLLIALRAEWTRNIMDDASDSNESQDDFLRYHAPSLRRLTRCLIECLIAQKELNGQLVFPSTESASFDENWQMLIDLRRIGGAHERDLEQCRTSEPGNSLSGNSVELMAFAIGFAANKNQMGFDQALLEKVATFTDAIIQSINPLSVWLVRYSSAVAIHTSGILNWSKGEVTMKGPNEEAMYEILETKRFELYMQALDLLQDNDSDVRTAAGRALSEGKSFTEKKSLSDSIVESTPVPLLSLETTYYKLSNNFSQETLSKRLMQQLLKRSENLQENLDFILGEFSCSENALDNDSKSVTNILNLNTKRRIFENEDPNPFEEDLVITQLATSAMILLGKSPQLPHNIRDEVYRRGKLVMNILKQRRSNDIAHELSWHGHVFSGVFTSLVACTCLIFLGCQNDLKINEDAKHVINKLKEDKRYNSMHPCMCNLLQTLSSAQAGSEQTKKELLRCCFLLPHNK